MLEVNELCFEIPLTVGAGVGIYTHSTRVQRFAFDFRCGQRHEYRCGRKKPAKYSAALKGIVWHGRFEGRIAAEIGENCPQTTGRKAPCSHIAVLPRIFGGVGGRRAEPFVPDLAGSVHFGFAQGICRLGHHTFRQAVLTQLLQHTPRAQLGGAAMNQTFGEALLREPVTRLEFVEQGFKLGGIFTMRRQLARQFGARVFAAREQPDGAGLEGQRAPRHATPYSPSGAGALGAAGAATLCMGAMPSFSRTRFSISRAISGFSRRYSRTLSLPCPMRVPL